MRLPRVTIASVLLAALLLPVGSASAGKFYWHHQRTRTRCCLPDRDYGKTVWPFTEPQSFGATAIAVAASDPTAGGEQRKPFHFRALALRVDHLTLDQVGMSLYKSDGQLVATGRITHAGGDGGLIGNNVTIRVRAYVAPTNIAAPTFTVAAPPPIVPGSAPAAAGVPSPAPARSVPATAAGAGVRQPEVLPLPAPEASIVPTQVTESVSPPANVPVVASPNDATRIPPDAFVVWKSEHKLWVARGRPEHISLVPRGEDFPQAEKLTRHFDEITYLEVELEYKRDR